MVSLAVLCVLTTASLLLVPAPAHRDQDTSSRSSKMQATVEAAARSSLDHMLETLEHECKPDRETYEATEGGIEALKECVRALEAYATKVKEHEVQSYVAHGKYRRAFIQTYALLKSVLDEDGTDSKGKP